jgi:hypothetical protein
MRHHHPIYHSLKYFLLYLPIQWGDAMKKRWKIIIGVVVAAVIVAIVLCCRHCCKNHCGCCGKK